MSSVICDMWLYDMYYIVGTARIVLYQTKRVFEIKFRTRGTVISEKLDTNYGVGVTFIRIC